MTNPHKARVALLAGSALLVLGVELLNSGPAAAIDRVSFEHHESSKRAKNYGIAAVFLSFVPCGGTGITALGSRLGR